MQACARGTTVKNVRLDGAAARQPLLRVGNDPTHLPCCHAGARPPCWCCCDRVRAC